MMGHVCDKCMKVGGIVFLAFGLAYLAVDLNWWDFWNIQWWTALFLAMGLGSLGSASCKDCQAMRKGMMKK